MTDSTLGTALHDVNRAQTLELTVNGVAHTVDLEDTGNDPGWWHTSWKAVRIEGIVLAAGPTNTIELSTSETYPNVSLDDVLVSTADDLAGVQPHRQALALSASDRSALVAYLLQLDGNLGENPGSPIFADGFESGDTQAWSSSVP